MSIPASPTAPNAAPAPEPIPCHVFTFKPRFAPLVEKHTKRQTIRPKRERQVNPGDRLSLREWLGAAYRSKQRLLKETTCTSTASVSISSNGRIYVAGRQLTTAQAEAFAKADGFVDRADFIGWFRAEHDLPFKAGTLYCWE